MQRVRMSVPYLKDLGWDCEIVAVDEKYADIVKDELLLQSIPKDIIVHKVRAFDKKTTSKLGLGSIALRSLWFYRQTVNRILRSKKFDLVYFSTTQFPVCILGAYWKRRFNIPYVIDMQDPWHSDYYRDKPKSERPPKYWFSYYLNKKLEPIALKNCDGLISVSANYIHKLKMRYPLIKEIPGETITFGAFEPDLKIAADHSDSFKNLLPQGFINIVYVGRGGNDMHKAVGHLFKAFQSYCTSNPGAEKKIRFSFIGTSYAQAGKGIPTIMPLARQYELDDCVIEITDRISYYHTLVTLQKADALFIPGSDDPDYTASKIYPYLLTNKPLAALFNLQSPAYAVFKEYGVTDTYDFDTPDLEGRLSLFFSKILTGAADVHYSSSAAKKYSAKNMAIRQCDFFDKIIKSQN